MAKLSDITAAAILSLLGNRTNNKPVLSINIGGAATVKTTAAPVYTVNGVAYTGSILAAQSVAITHDENGNAYLGYVQPAGVTAYYTLALNAAGTVSVVQGMFAGQKAGTDPTVGVGPAYSMGASFIGGGRVPDVPAGYTPFGVIKVVTAGAATFTPGTTALDAVNVTVTYFDVAVIPSSLL
jgi:hypothetical protein